MRSVASAAEVLCRDKESLLLQDGDSVGTHGTARETRAQDTILRARDMGTRRARQDRNRDFSVATDWSNDHNRKKKSKF